jgi:hypothetical protein
LIVGFATQSISCVREISFTGFSEYNFNNTKASKHIIVINKKFFGRIGGICGFGILGGSCFGIRGR